MDIIVTGLGSVGYSIVKELTEEGHNVVVIDIKSSKVERVLNDFDVKGVIGNCASREILKEAGVSSCDLLIACTSTDELNILTCIMAKKLGADKTIARASKPEYNGMFNDEDLGIGLVVNPQKVTAQQISNMLRFPSAIKVEQFSNGKAELVEIRVPNDSQLVGIQLKELCTTFNTKVLVVAAQRGSKAVIPSGNFLISAGDRLYITATRKNIIQFFKKLGWNSTAKDVMLVGCSTTAFYLCQELEKSNMDIKIIEKDRKKCIDYAGKLNNVDIIYGDASDQELLKEEGINSVDAFVPLGNIDEQNIVLSMTAQAAGVPKVITKIDQESYMSMLEKSGLYSAVSTKTSAADQIIRFIRIMNNKSGRGVKRLFHIMDDQAEILEFEALDTFKKFEKPIMDLNLKNNILIAGIIRDGELITPSGQDVIKPNDNVIIVTLNEGFTELNDILDF